MDQLQSSQANIFAKFITTNSESSNTSSMVSSISDLVDEPSSLSSSRSLDTLPSLLFKFIQTAAKHPAYQGERSHVHTSIIYAYMIAVSLQSATVPSTPPFRRNIGLRDLAQRLHLWEVDVSPQVHRDALKAITLLDGYIRNALKAEMDFIEAVEAKVNKRPNNQIGGLFGDGEVPASEAKRELAVLRYQSCLVLERLEKMLREQVIFGEVSGEEGLEMDDLRACLPQLLVQFLPKANDIHPNPALEKYKAEAFFAIEDYRHRVNVCTEELSQIMNTDAGSAALQKGVTKLWDIESAYNKMTQALDQLMEKEKEKEKESDVD